MQKRTQYWQVERMDTPSLLHHPGIQSAATMLKKGKVVAFPTETVYGLGGDATSEKAVDSIFKAKGRPSDNPLIVHIADTDQMKSLVREVPPIARKLMSRFWPGPLTLIFPHEDRVVPRVTAGLDTMGIRMPDHPVALALLKLAGVPVAAPSANLSGKPSPTKATHVWHDLAGQIDAVIDGGATGVGVESTVLDISGEVPVLLRPGGITRTMLEEVLGPIQTDQNMEQPVISPRSPGMKYRHYAPAGKMWLVIGEGMGIKKKVQELADQGEKEGRQVAIMTTEEHKDFYRARWVLTCGKYRQPETVAQGLYECLRQFDQLGADWIVAEGFPPVGLFHSVMNRLIKAAEGRVIHS